MRYYIISLVILFSLFIKAQERTILRGKVLYGNNNVANENVVNVTSGTATITNGDGEFQILVSEGDELVFSALQFKLRTVVVTDAILKNNRLVVEVTEKITELDEVVIGPENTEKFIDLKEEEFKGFDYEQDKATPITNAAVDMNELQYGINFVNIYKALFRSKREKEPSSDLAFSEVLRQVYEDDFFVRDLLIPQEKIDDFLYYCDNKMPSRVLLRQSNEFQLIDYLVAQSKAYRAQ